MGQAKIAAQFNLSASIMIVNKNRTRGQIKGYTNFYFADEVCPDFLHGIEN
jgi:hypothetical protein